MLRSAKELKGYSIHAVDGDIGHVDDFYFDDRSWTIQYLVADVGKWLQGRKKLISPISLNPPNWGRRSFPVSLTKDKIKNSPDMATHIPVSLKYQRELHGYYGWPINWDSGSISGYAEPLLSTLQETEGKRTQTSETEECEDCRLQSVRDVTGYRIHAGDGNIGHTEDFIIDDETWDIRYIVVDTRILFQGKRVLIPPQWIREVNWMDGILHLSHSRKEIEESPIFNPSEPINRRYEETLYDYYGRPKYWENRKQPKPGE